MTRLRKLASGAGWCGLFLIFAVSAGDVLDTKGNPMTDLERGLALMRERRHAEAALVLAEVAEDNPTADPELVLGSLAECQFYIGQYAEALATCDQLAQRRPNTGRANLIRALVYIRTGRTEEGYAEARLAYRRGERIALTLLPAE